MGAIEHKRFEIPNGWKEDRKTNETICRTLQGQESSSTNAMELELPSTVKIHPVVNISKVCKYKNQVEGQRKDIMNQLDPIEELYDMYSEKEDTPRIVELVDDGLDFDSDVEGPANSYMDL